MMRWEQVACWAGSPNRGAEVGVRSGVTTGYLLNRFPKLHMIAVDLWKPQPSTGEAGNEDYADWDFAKIRAEFTERIKPYAKRVTVIEADSVAAATKIADHSLDFVFIDANHGYSAVKADIAAWIGKVRLGGVLCGHDYWDRFPGVAQALKETGRAISTGAEHTWCIRC